MLTHAGRYQHLFLLLSTHEGGHSERGFLRQSSETPQIFFHSEGVPRDSQGVSVVGHAGMSVALGLDARGRSTVQITLNLYTHVLPQLQDAAVSLLDDLWE